MADRRRSTRGASRRKSALIDLVKRVTGVDLEATQTFLHDDCLDPGRGFWSQYVGSGKVSAATTAICVYALSEMGLLVEAEKREFQRLLLAFRDEESGGQGAAFPRTSGRAANTWTTGQAALALLSVGTSWSLVKPSVEWLLAAQGADGSWNYPGTTEGRDRLIYSLYPTLTLLRCRAHVPRQARAAFSRLTQFLNACEERQDPFWAPLRLHLRRLVAVGPRDKRVDPEPYAQLFDTGWPGTRVDEDWLPDRFGMALTCGPNYLHLRHVVAPGDPLALLHVRYLADERIGSGWSDTHEQQPKTWATALGALTLFRWASDVLREGTSITRLPTRSELVAARTGPQTGRRLSSSARELLRRVAALRPGSEHATKYQTWVRDTFTFLFGDALKEPKMESATFLGTLRRDVTFRNAAQAGPWLDWKREHSTASVPIECKNKASLHHTDLWQTACYLGKRMGMFGILACRNTTTDDEREILNWFVNNDDKYVLVVNDEALVDWIRLKDRGGDPTAALADLYRSLREGGQ